MQNLNYFYFIIITLTGLYFLVKGKGERIIKNPLNKGQYVIFNGLEMFWIFTFSTGLLAFSAEVGLDLMAIRLLVLEIFCLLGLFISDRKSVWNLVTITYLLYLIWLIVGLTYTSNIMFGIRVILKYIYPFLIMLFASAVTWNREMFFKAAYGARIVALISAIIAFIPNVEWYVFPNVFWYGTARAIHYIPMAIFSLTLFYHLDQKKKENLILTVVFIIPCVLWIYRTSMIGTTLALVVFFFFKYKFRSLPIIALVFLLAIASVFYIPAVRNKMFNPGEKFEMSQLFDGDITMDDVNTNARSVMWEWSLKNYYKGHEIIGTGTGNLQRAFYQEQEFSRGGRGIVHNDYIQILCDNGLIGIILYLPAGLFAIIHCFILYNRKYYPPVLRICAITAGASMAGVLITLYSDNVVNYSMATLSYPWGFYGMMLGLHKQLKTKLPQFL